MRKLRIKDFKKGLAAYRRHLGLRMKRMNSAVLLARIVKRKENGTLFYCRL